MAVTNRTVVSCADCSEWEALYNWKGDERGGICSGLEWFPKPKCEELCDLECHTLYERLEAYCDDRD